MTTRARKAVAIVAIVIAALAVLGGVIAGIWFGVNTDKYQGYVRDEAGEPIAGVSVTNGRDAKTDSSPSRSRAAIGPKISIVTKIPTISILCSKSGRTT